MTRNTGECPRDAVESRLSQILEADALPKYYLSREACLGIVRRAERRGKVLPPELKTALLRQAGEPVEDGGSGEEKTICLQGNGIDRADTAGCNGRGWCEDESYTLNTIDRPAVFDNHSQDSRVNECRDGTVPTLSGKAGTGGNNLPIVAEHYRKSKRAQTEQDNETWVQDDHTNTLNAFDIGDVRATDVCAYAVGNGQADQSHLHEVAGAINCMHDQQAVMVGYTSPNFGEKRESETCDTLRGSGGDLSQGGAETLVREVERRNCTRIRNTVRRLTPRECERLQGFPDDWTLIGDWVDSRGKKRKCSDGARYRALGNSIALPFWRFLCKRISAEYVGTPTMASLFDGIGGFPLIWESINGKGTAVWASEIEEFCIAVTKKHFGEE